MRRASLRVGSGAARSHAQRAARSVGQGTPLSPSREHGEYGEHPPFDAPEHRGTNLLQSPPDCGIVQGSRKVPMADTSVKSIFDMEPDAAHEARLDAEAMAAYRAGRVVPHERVREWLMKLAKGERVPPPRA